MAPETFLFIEFMEGLLFLHKLLLFLKNVSVEPEIL